MSRKRNRPTLDTAGRSRQGTAAATIPRGCPCGCLTKPGYFDDPDCVRHREVEPRCDVCLTFDFGERERLETCWQSNRCPLAGSIIGGGGRR